MSVDQYRLPNLKDKFRQQEEQKIAEEKAAWAEKAKKAKAKKVGINSKKKTKK